MNIKKLNEHDYNKLQHKPKCKVTGIELTWQQYMSFGLYSSSRIKKLFRIHKNVKIVRALIKDWVYFAPTRTHYRDVASWSKFTQRSDVPVETRKLFYDETFRPTSACKFPNCLKTVPFEMVGYGFCCMQHKNQHRRIRLKHYHVEDLKYICHLDNLAFLRKEDVATHLRFGHHFKDEQMEQYFRTYLLKPTDNQGFCKWCNEPTRLYNFARGYNDFCNYSCSVKWYNKNTDRLQQCSESMRRITAAGDVTHTQLGYWRKRGFSRSEASRILKRLVRYRQNDVPTLIRRYGISKDEALLLRKEITRKWITKFHFKMRYSVTSQDFLWLLWERIKSHIAPERVYFATFNRGQRDSKKNFEWLQETQLTFYKFDFFISGINFVIEFDDANHLRSIAVESDLARDVAVKAAFKGKGIIHRVPVKKFTRDPNGTVEAAANLIFAALDNERESG